MKSICKILTIFLLAIFFVPAAFAGDLNDQDFAKGMDAFLAKDDNVKKITEALRRYVQTQEQEAKKQATESQFSNPVKIDIGTSPVRGNKDAKITIVAFSDFQCPYCKRGADNVQEVLDSHKNDVKIVFKNLPLPFHDKAKPAAIAALAAGKQGKFWEMHDKLFNNQADLSDEAYEKYAKELSLDVAKFKKDLADQAISKQVDDDMELANKLGVRGTPGFFINGVSLQGAQPASEFNRIIEEWKKRGV